MGNTTISETAMAAALQQNLALRDRINAIAQNALWAGSGDPRMAVDLDAVAWAVASEPQVRGQIRAAMDDEENTNLSRNIDAIKDDLLTPTVMSAMKRLGYEV